MSPMLTTCQEERSRIRGRRFGAAETKAGATPAASIV